MNVESVIENAMASLGFEVVDWGFANRGRLLRVFIDKAGGVGVEDCVEASNHLSRVLAVELNLDYDRLEVSSPGLDRVLKKPGDFERFAGQKALVKLRMPVNGRRNWVGVLKGWREGSVELEVDGTSQSFPMENIDKARLVPQW